MGDAVYERLVSFVKENSVFTGLIATATIGVVWYIYTGCFITTVTKIEADKYLYRTLNDFSSWKAFGTGGTPPTWSYVCLVIQKHSNLDLILS
jgi:hypothetical protein